MVAGAAVRGFGRGWVSATSEAEEAAEGGDGEKDAHAGVEEEGWGGVPVAEADDALVDAVDADPVAVEEGRLEGNAAAEVAGVEGEEEVCEEDGGECGEEARGAPADRGEEEGEEGEEEEGCVEEEVEELGEGVAEGEGGGQYVLGDDVGLVLEPLHAGEDEEDAGEGEGGAGEEDAAFTEEAAAGLWAAAVGLKEPERGGEKDEDAEPGDLAGGAAEGVGEDGEAEPGDGGAGRGGEEGAKAAVEAEEDGEEAEDVGHVGDREHEVERREDEGEGAEGGVALGDAGEREGALEEEGECHGDQHGAASDGGEGEAEELDEGGAEVELPAEHGCGPSVVDDVAGGGEGAGHEDVGAVVADAHVGVGAGDEFAGEHGEGAEDGREVEATGELQTAS